MKADRLALRCDVVAPGGEQTRWFLGRLASVLAQVLVATTSARDLTWDIECDGTEIEGSSHSTSDAIRAITGVRCLRTLNAMVEGRCALSQEWWAELTVNPVPSGHCEAFIQVVFEGTLLDKAAARPYEILFKDALTGLLMTKNGHITQAFISDDLEPGDLPMESALRIPSRRAWEESATFLRNVSWITYLNAGMVTHLQDHGISVDDVGVERWTCPAEGVMIQFTEHLEDFTDETVIAAWRSLLPLLPTDEQPSRPPRYASLRAPRCRNRPQVSWTGSGM